MELQLLQAMLKIAEALNYSATYKQSLIEEINAKKVQLDPFNIMNPGKVLHPKLLT